MAAGVTDRLREMSDLVDMHSKRDKRERRNERKLAMTDQAQQFETIDPYNVPETLCIGRFNIAITGAFATLTFTHERPDPSALLGEGRIDAKAIVRARIVTTVDNLHALRDLLVNLTQSSVTPAPATGGSTRH
jgi:hypothetical protein